MALSNDLIAQFVKATQDKKDTNQETTAYGKIVESDGQQYVQLDGSDLLTPISSTTVVHDGDRVIVTIKNHTATVTGDLTNPAANNKDVQEIGSQVSQFQIVLADKVSTSQLEAEIARIEQLRVEELNATNAKIETLEGKVAKVDEFEAEVAKIEQMEAKVAKVDTLEADIATFKSTTTEDLEAMNAAINNLDATYVSADELEATNATIAELNAKKLDAETATAKYATIENLNSANAEINTLKTNKLDATEANATYATIQNLNSANAEIDNLKTNKLDAESAKVIFADIDFSNITQAAIQELFTESGIIEDLIVKEGKITGELVGVTIKGDLVEAGTLKADRLVVLGTDGLYYKLNVNALGETTASSDAKYQTGLDGSVIVAKSITADRVAVTDLVAFGATIGGFNITNNAIYSGAKGGVASTAAGIYQDKEGQFAVGDGTNFVKFYKDQNGKYKLEISADSLSFGSEKKTIESLSEEVAANSEAVKNNTDDLSEYISKTNASLSNLQGQIDGAIMTHFEEYAPLPSKEDNTSANSPAKEWIEADASINKNDQKNNHLGDLFYNTITGYCYRWQVLNNQYFWELVKDVDVTKALADAAKAQDTADGKRRVFVETPTPPYDVGDLWSQGSTGDLMRCKTAKTKDQTYAAADWEKASKYTDDTAVNALGTRVTTAETKINQNSEAIELRATKTEVTEVNTTATNALSTANTAKSTANTAQSTANTVSNNLSTNYYNKTQTDAKIKVEADKIALQATQISETNEKIEDVETDLATNYYNKTQADAKLQVESDRITSTVNKLTTVETTANTAKSTADTAKTTATNAATTAGEAKTAASNAQSTANTAKSTADTAKSTADTAKSTADTAKSTADKAKADVTTLTTRVTSAETKIDQNADAIALRATKTEVEEVKTTATNAKNAIDNLEVGGRNYIPESDKTYTITMTGSTGYNYVILDVSPELPKLDPSVRTFTISYDAKSQNGGTKLQGYLRASSSASAMSSSPDMGISTTSWARYSRVATLNDGWTVADIATFYARIQGTADDTVYVKNIKVEVGNKKTDWSPAPEDIKTELTTNYYTKTQTDSQIEVVTNAINLKVTSVETTANNASKTASDASTAASNAASKAQTAQNTADQAKTTATTANNTANTAKSTADTAKSTADTAKSTADTASSTATTAKNTADAASKTASEAKTAAQNAQDAADAAQEDIDNLEIGGRNLCIESSYTDGYLGSAGAIVAPTSYNKERTTDFINVTPGENITIQFWVTTVNTADTPWHAYQYFDANQVAVGDRYASGYAYTGENNHIIYNRVVPEGVASIRLSMRTYEDGKMKLEKGNKPTDWTPAPEDIETEVTTVISRVADLEVSSTNITASVTSIQETQKNTIDTLGNINTDIATLSKTVESKMDSESVNIAIKSELANGVSKVQTTTGYRLDDEGLTISKTGADTSTNIDEDGMSIYRTNDNEEVLTADSDGVNAFNLHARTYLIIGETSRFEDYVQNNKKRTGCFWIGGE